MCPRLPLGRDTAPNRNVFRLRVIFGPPGGRKITRKRGRGGWEGEGDGSEGAAAGFVAEDLLDEFLCLVATILGHEDA